MSKSGWKDEKAFQKYKLAWEKYRSDYNEENSKIKQANYVIAGDSLVHLFSNDLIKKEFPAITLIPRGIGGDMTESLLERLPDNVISLSPKTLIIEIGGNDLIYGKCLGLMEKNIKKIINEVQAKLPETEIIFISVPPTAIPRLNSIVPVYNQFLSKLEKKYKNISFVDLWEEMRDENIPTIKSEYLRERDPIHFNEKGYQLWGKLLRPYLNK